MNRDESGFTLTELLVVLVIMPLVIGAIAAVVVTGLINQQSVSTRITDSTSAEQASAYFGKDVDSANFVTTDQSLTVGSPTDPPCGFPAPATASVTDPVTTEGTFLLGLAWGSSGPDTASSSSVSYASDGNGNLVRLWCQGDTTTPLSAVTVATGLAQPATPCSAAETQTDPFSCLGVAISVAPEQAAALAAAGWESTAGNPPISGITLNGLTAATQYGFTLVGVPQIATPQNQGVAAGTPSESSLLLLNTTSTSLDCSGGIINVSGGATINSPTTPAATLSNNAQLNVGGQIYTPDPSGAIATSTGASVSTSPQSGSAIDPYRNLPLPSGSGGSESGTNPIVFSQGTYGSIDLSGTQQGILNPGTYIVGGLNLSGNATLTSADGGVLIYVSSGTVSVTGSAVLTLTAQTSGSYAGVALWQDQSDGNTLTLSSSSTNSTISGAVYAPAATVTGGSGGDFSVGQLVAGNLDCPVNGLVTIG